MPNVLVEFSICGRSDYTNFVEIINTDYLKTTNEYPKEARFAGHLNAAMDDSEYKCGVMSKEVFNSYMQGNFRDKVVLKLPCMVEDHIVISVE